MQRLLLGFLLCLAACAGSPTGTGGSVETPAPVSLEPYQTASPRPTATLLAPLTTLVLPTTTPILYTIAKGDTLSSIAAHYNMTVDALLAANPGVNAGALVVGKTLVIPTGVQATGQPIPTPAAVAVTQARCWPEASGGLWCLALLQNPYAETLENLSVQFSLLDPTGQEIATQAAYGLLDILPAGRSMPLAAFFPAPMRADVQVRAQVLTAVRLLPGDPRYLPVHLDNTLVSLDATGRTAGVSGEAGLSGETSAGSLWILAAAYDAAGNVVGLQRWETETPLTPAVPLKFDFQVASLGPAIQRVDVLAEARP